jgi:RES domain-containing protein
MSPTAAQRIRLPEGATLDDVPVRAAKGRWWRQTSPRYGALAVLERARQGGRCHRKHEPSPCYASSTETTAWGELFRHVYEEVSPFEMRRRMSEIEVTHLPVVDFEDPYVRTMFSVSERSLVSNNYAACRKIADLLRQRPDRFGGMILPSAAVPGERTLVVFRDRVPDHLAVVKETVGTTPTRLLPLFRRIAETLPRPIRSVAKFFIRQIERELSARAKKELLGRVRPA